MAGHFALKCRREAAKAAIRVVPRYDSDLVVPEVHYKWTSGFSCIDDYLTGAVVWKSEREDKNEDAEVY